MPNQQQIHEWINEARRILALGGEKKEIAKLERAFDKFGLELDGGQKDLLPRLAQAVIKASEKFLQSATTEVGETVAIELDGLNQKLAPQDTVPIEPVQDGADLPKFSTKAASTLLQTWLTNSHLKTFGDAVLTTEEKVAEFTDRFAAWVAEDGKEDVQRLIRQYYDKTYVKPQKEKLAAEESRVRKRWNVILPQVDSIHTAVAAGRYAPLLDPLDSCVNEFYVALDAIEDTQQRGAFGQTNVALSDLQVAVKNIQAARLKLFENEIQGADTPDKVKDVVHKLEPHEIAGLGPEKQLSFLKTLRGTQGSSNPVCSFCRIPWTHSEYDCKNNLGNGPCPGIKADNQSQKGDVYDLARNKLFAQMEFHPKFLEHSKKVNNETARVFTEGEGEVLFSEAKNEWPKWPFEKRKEFLIKAAELQCTAFGFKNGLPEIKEDPNLGDNDSGACEFSLFKGQQATVITLNPKGTGLDDFENVFNTIMHENAHNYQMYLVKKYGPDGANKEELFKEHPEVEAFELQIQMWQENFQGYVVPPENYDEKDPGHREIMNAYKSQPTEKHSYMVEEKISRKIKQAKLGIRRPKRN